MKRFVALVAVAVTALSMPASAETPKDQLVIGTNLSTLVTLDPQQGQEFRAIEIIANIYDRLVSVDQLDGNKIVGDLAESWDVDADGITFHLKDAKFVSGNPVTAKDVEFSIERLLELDQAAANNFKTGGYTKDNIEALAVAVDERTFRMDYAPEVEEQGLLNRLAMGVASVVDSAEVEKHVVNGDFGNEWLRVNSAGSGPYVLNRWTPNEIVILDANTQYWDGAPTMQRVIMRHVPESQAARLMLDRGDIDVANALVASDIATFQSSDKFDVQSVVTGGFYTLSMNASNEYLAKPQVREAIARAIDRVGIAKTILGTYGRPRTVPVPENWEGAIADPGWDYDPEKARALLAEAGLADGFDLRLVVISQTPRIEMATAIQANLAAVGIRVEIQQGAGADIVPRHRSRDYDLLIGNTAAYMPTALGAMDIFTYNPDNSLEADNGGNLVWRSAWDIPELTALTVAARSERDKAKQQAMIKKMQELFIEERPAVLPMFERFEPIVVSKRVSGYVGHPMSVLRVNHVTKN